MGKMLSSMEKLKDNPNATFWRELAVATLCRMTVFNKRRGDETGQMLLTSYQNRLPYKGSNEITHALQPMERKLVSRLQLVEIVGKRNRKVPVLLTEDMVRALDCLIACRCQAGIVEKNRYLFAAPGSQNGYLKGWDALHMISKQANLVQPHLLTTTSLRKYIATVSQIVDSSEQELEWLANHMGHDLSVHRQYYRLQEQTLELTLVSQLLIAVDDGKCYEYFGKKLDEINLEDLPSASDHDVDITEKDADIDNVDIIANAEADMVKTSSSVDVEATDSTADAVAVKEDTED